MNPKESLADLLLVNGMRSDSLDLGTMTQLFLAQMRISLYGGASTIPMLPTFLRPFGPLPDGETVAVAEVDDSQVRVSLVTFDGGKGSAEEIASFPVPGREYPAPFEDLIFAAAELLEPVLEQAGRIALCLPFPIDYDGEGDGCLRRFPGNMTVEDFEGKPVLAALKQELDDRGSPALPMVLVSTPDAVLAAAGVQNPKQSRYIGLTWGDTLDVGFVAPGSIVLRWLGIKGDLMLFDGAFSAFEAVPFGMADYSKDRDCYAPGRDLYLKMAATSYLGDTFRLVMIKAAERKLLTFGCSRDILSLTWLDLAEVAEFLREPEGDGTIAHFCREPEDRAVALVVARAVLDRAARLVCANLSAVLSFIGAGREADAPVCIGAWGGAFDLPLIRELLEQHLNTFTRDTLGIHTTLFRGGEMPAVGAAAVALYNTENQRR